MDWLWQLSSTPTIATINNATVEVFDLDLFDTPQATIDHIHSLGKAMICYVDTTYEPGRPDSSQFTASVLGNGIDGWPGQKWVDIRSTIVRNIMLGRLKTAVSKDCDAIEWDDVDSYQNNPGFPITAADQISFNTFLANATRAAGLSAGLKNDLDQVDKLVSYYDWALNEQCNQYNECNTLTPFTSAGKAVFGTEYSGNAATFCPKLNTLNFSWLKNDLDLDGKNVVHCCTYRTPPCAKVGYTC